MALILTAAEKTQVDALAAEIDDMNATGLQAPVGIPYAITVVPVDGYRNIIQVGSANQEGALNGMRAGFAALARRFGPIAYSNLITAQSPMSWTVATTICSLTIPTLQISRNVVVSGNFTAFVSAGDTGIDFWLEINGGTPTAHSRFYFNFGSMHQAISQSWALTLPPGSNVITLRASVRFGPGPLMTDANDSAGLSLVG